MSKRDEMADGGAVDSILTQAVVELEQRLNPGHGKRPYMFALVIAETPDKVGSFTAEELFEGRRFLGGGNMEADLQHGFLSEYLRRFDGGAMTVEPYPVPGKAN